jgi:hypothetical protein
MNSTNFNKRNNYTPPEKKTEHKKKRPRHMMLEIQVLACDRHKKVAGLNWWIPTLLLNGILTLLLNGILTLLHNGILTFLLNGILTLLL